MEKVCHLPEERGSMTWLCKAEPEQTTRFVQGRGGGDLPSLNLGMLQSLTQP